MSRTGRMTLLTAANFAMLLVSAVLLAIVVRDQITSFQLKRARERPVIGHKVVGMPRSPERYAVVTLVLSTQCPYCAEGVPFYQELARAASVSNGHMAVAARFLPNQPGDVFLRQNGLGAVLYLGPVNASLPVTTVPALLVSDKNDKVARIWFGYLDDAKRHEVYGTVADLCPLCQVKSTARKTP